MNNYVKRSNKSNLECQERKIMVTIGTILLLYNIYNCRQLFNIVSYRYLDILQERCVYLYKINLVARCS